ncbi:helix-turn-helix transcriptional regulator [Halobellus ordinarius]|uniref:helix-turn-helix transcriptional regulator n=1 Tax=Halobellus ordinarius TaxID=3075120 RepID=UPI002880528E|nr:hypothetical protein [Halobellus sp. ZY16]
MPDRAARLACLGLVVVALLGAAAPGATAQPTGTIADTQIDPDDVSLQIDLRSDGSAAWTVEYRVRLDDDNATEAFLSLRDDIEANESQYSGQFRDRMTATAQTAENATGREMAIENVSVAATRQQLPQDYGVVTYTFVWTNFAAVEDGEIRAGDALAGLFLDSETSLQFSWPAGYGIETVQPEPTDRREDSQVVVWSGPLDFGPEEPTLVVTEAAAGGDTTTAAVDGSGDDDGGTDSGLGSLPLVAALVVLALVVVVGGWYVLRQGEDDGGSPVAAAGGGRDGGSSGAAATPEASQSDDVSAGAGNGTIGADEAAAAEPDAGAVAGATAGAAAGTAADSDDESGSEAAESAAASGEEDTGDVDPWEDELLSNQERVLALVEHKGGRMKQQEVAGTLDWTDAKTSQVVRKMRDEGDLDAFRLGRENVLVLPDEEFGPSGPDEE